jgi:hypothetical protein
MAAQRVGGQILIIRDSDAPGVVYPKIAPETPAVTE